MIEFRQREAVVAEARSWIGTPYHHAARLKGVGVDCAQIIAAVFENAGVVPPIPIPRYPPDWHLNRSAERYMGIVLQHGREIAGPPQPGDIILLRFGRCFSHGGIVTDWPLMVHAWMPAHRVLEVDYSRDAQLTHIGERGPDLGRERPRRFFSHWGRDGVLP